MFKEYFGIYYDDYKNDIRLQRELYEAKRSTPNGILKRIKNGYYHEKPLSKCNDTNLQ